MSGRWQAGAAPVLVGVVAGGLVGLMGVGSGPAGPAGAGTLATTAVTSLVVPHPGLAAVPG